MRIRPTSALTDAKNYCIINRRTINLHICICTCWSYFS